MSSWLGIKPVGSVYIASWSLFPKVYREAGEEVWRSPKSKSLKLNNVSIMPAAKYKDIATLCAWNTTVSGTPSKDGDDAVNNIL